MSSLKILLLLDICSIYNLQICMRLEMNINVGYKLKKLSSQLLFFDWLLL